MGRPREFDEASVLAAAADAFWSRGYEGTSTRDLTACTGLTPSSIYGAYGDKRALFLRALEHYLDSTLRQRIARLDAAASPALAIQGFFDEIIEYSLGDTLQRGCMLVNSCLESSLDDDAVQTALAHELTVIETFFHRCLVAGQQAGEISTDIAAEDAARHLLAVLLGLRVLARVRPEPALLTGAVRQALATLGMHPPMAETVRPASDR